MVCSHLYRLALGLEDLVALLPVPRLVASGLAIAGTIHLLGQVWEQGQLPALSGCLGGSGLPGGAARVT